MSWASPRRIGGLSFGATNARVHLLPGKHALRVRFCQEGYEYVGSTGQRKTYLYAREGRDIHFVGRAGSIYYLQATRKGQDWTATVERRVEKGAERKGEGEDRKKP